MHWPKKRWIILYVTVIITMAVLSGGRFLWQHYAVEKPLTELLQQTDGVASFYIEDKAADGMLRVHVTLENVTSLDTTYQTLNDNASKILGAKKYKLIIHDHRTAELEKLYYSSHYYVQEAIFTGNFSSMADHIQKIAATANAQVKIFVDAKYVYLDLRSGTGEMYVVVPRLAGSEVK